MNHTTPWNPAHFGEVNRRFEPNGQETIFYEDEQEPPAPEEFKTLQEYEQAWQRWLTNNQWYLEESAT